MLHGVYPALGGVQHDKPGSLDNRLGWVYMLADALSLPEDFFLYGLVSFAFGAIWYDIPLSHIIRLLVGG
jgi:hypothetical protein